MEISPEQQKLVIDRAVLLSDSWKQHWDKFYNGTCKDYRLMADGKLPAKMQAEMDAKENEYLSKLVPQVIPTTNEFLKTTIINSLFNRDSVFECVGRRQEDSARARDAMDVVSYQMDYTKYKDEFSMIVEDSLGIGIGYGEDQFVTEYEPVSTMDGPILASPSLEKVYEGVRMIRKRPETIYPDPVATRIENMSGYFEFFFTSISTLLIEAKSGVYQEYADNVNKIRSGDFDKELRASINRYTDHDYNESPDGDDTDDFPVLALRMWRRFAEQRGQIPTWHLVEIANHKKNPLILRYDINPLKTNNHPLKACRIFPVNDRLIGKCTAEKIGDYMLEKFQCKNRIIDITNDVADLAGMLFAPDTVFDKNSMPVKRRKVIKTSALASEIKDIPLNTTPIPHLMAREDRIDRETQETMATPPIAMGMAPNRRDPATTSSIVDENSKIRGNGPIKAAEDTLLLPSIKDHILLSQLHLSEEYAYRILGKNGLWDYRKTKKTDIQGQFDIKCYGSTEVLTKGVKLALFEKALGIFAGNPHVRIDWQGMARLYYKMAEIPGAIELIPELSKEEADAERENTALMGGVAWQAIESDNHEAHIPIHLKAKDMLEQQIAALEFQGDEESIQQITALVSFFDTHISQHEQFRQAINGQINVGQGTQIPMMTNQEELLKTVASDQNEAVMGNG